tara:strand:- start:513 stop:614 length:102 start_codon:yes stop_codon:yes gene_type:complete
MEEHKVPIPNYELMYRLISEEDPEKTEEWFKSL